LRIEDGDGVNRAAATPAADLCPGAAAGALCGAGSDAEAVRLEEKAGPSRAASREEDDDQHNDDDYGTGPVNRRLGV
jgi:hypothetical protein